jgi:hypothetical protein
LDVLRIQPYMTMAGLGGRVPGKININTITDKRVWDALFDAQSPSPTTPNTQQTPPLNSYNTFTQADVDAMWNTMIGSRTPSVLQPSNQRFLLPNYNNVSPGSYGATTTQFGIPDSKGTSSSGSLTKTYTYNTPVPGASVYDSPISTVGTDRPFLPFGAPTYAASAGGFAFQQGSGLMTDTLVRGTATQGTYIMQASNAGALIYPYPNPYQQVEALRKIFNNTTTVSHTFAVWVTVGYFDYNAPALGAAPVLGAEYYNVVPGDLRRKYFSVVDRSMVGLDPQSLSTGQLAQSKNAPFYTTVDAINVKAGDQKIVISTTSTANGAAGQNTVNIGSGTLTCNGSNSSWISIGTGATQEYVRVDSSEQYPPYVAPPKPPVTPMNNVSLLHLATPLKYYHYQGETVSNIVPGYPGPGAGSLGTPGAPTGSFNFNYSQPPFKSQSDSTSSPYNYSSIVPFTVRLQ